MSAALAVLRKTPFLHQRVAAQFQRLRTDAEIGWADALHLLHGFTELPVDGPMRWRMGKTQLESQSRPHSQAETTPAPVCRPKPPTAGMRF